MKESAMGKGKHLNLKTDFGFKRIFRDEPTNKYLVSLINSCIKGLTSEVSGLFLLDSEKLGIDASSKRMVFDIFCISSENEHYIVEMQFQKQNYYIERAISYASRVIDSFNFRGERKYDIMPVYSINFLNFDLLDSDDDNDYFSVYQTKNQKNKILSKCTTYIFAEMTKFAKSIKKEEIKTDLDKWLYCINNMHLLEEGECPFEDPIFKSLEEDCKISKLGTMEKEKYEKSIFDFEDVQDSIACSREEGYIEGRAEGEAERNLEIARKMLEEGLDMNLICKITGLTEEEIKKKSY